MRKIIFNSILLCMILLLAACGVSGNPDSTSSVDAGETLDLQIAGQSPEDHPSTQALNEFAEKISAETDGRINVKIFPANQLGDYTTIYKEIGQGTIDMALISLPGELDSRLRLNFLPYLVEGYHDDINEKIGKDSFVFNELQGINNDNDVQLLSFFANGFAGVGTSKEVPNLLDFGEDKDMLLRVPPDDVFNLPMADIGFRTVTIPLSDLYSGLQTGAADGWAGGEASLNYTGYRDVIKYFYKTNDFFNADSFIINKGLYEELSDEDRELIERLSEEMMEKSIEEAEEIDNEYLEQLEEEGIEVVEFSEEEIHELAEQIKEETWPKLKDTLGEEAIDELLGN